ncbi:DoxX family protein, partial [Enterococcus casseliflavus]|uniref:DoxX family protein n=1 Tax=Enterococcus casseliflavus TaxID=37734 RepID=UPI003D0A685C
RAIAYWIATILGPASFVIGGTLFLMGAEQPSTALAELGYPLYLLKILGVWKILGAVTAVAPGLPRLKEWMYAGFFFELTGAAASHALAGQP